MPASLDHTLVHATDAAASARFTAEILGLGPPRRVPPFWVLDTGNGARLDYYQTDAVPHFEHYAFRVSEVEFDEIFGRLRARGLAWSADPGARRPGEINRQDSGRGLYFRDPDGHLLEILTQRSGAGG